jgi:hypothetical protein
MVIFSGDLCPTDLGLWGETQLSQLGPAVNMNDVESVLVHVISDIR